MPTWITAALGFFKALFGLADDVTKEIHDHNQEVSGETKVIAKDNAATAKVNENVAKAAVATTDSVALDKLLDGSA